MVFLPTSYLSTTTPDLFLGETHRNVLHQLVTSVLHGSTFVGLTGPSGVGKTVLLKAALEIFGRQKLRVITADDGHVRASDLHRIVAHALLPNGLDRRARDVAQSLEHLCATVAADGSRVVLPIDNAHRLSNDAITYLWLISQIRGGLSYSRLQVVFVGQPGFWDLLDTDALLSFREQIVALQLGSMQQAEIRRYLKHRLQLSGYTARGASKRIIRDLLSYSRGIPREIDALADQWLAMERSEQTPRETPQEAPQVAR